VSRSGPPHGSRSRSATAPRSSPPGTQPPTPAWAPATRRCSRGPARHRAQAPGSAASHAARGGNKHLERALSLSAFAALHDPTYDRKRAQGKRHNAALICLDRYRVDAVALLQDRHNVTAPLPAWPASTNSITFPERHRAAETPNPGLPEPIRVLRETFSYVAVRALTKAAAHAPGDLLDPLPCIGASGA
jgi:hypothetical protein